MLTSANNGCPGYRANRHSRHLKTHQYRRARARFSNRGERQRENDAPDNSLAKVSPGRQLFPCPPRRITVGVPPEWLRTRRAKADQARCSLKAPLGDQDDARVLTGRLVETGKAEDGEE